MTVSPMARHVGHAGSAAGELGGEPRPTAAIPADNPCCSCKLTHVRSHCSCKLTRVQLQADTCSYRPTPPTAWRSGRSRWTRVPSLSMRQLWTAVQRDGPNHLGLWLIRRRVDRPGSDGRGACCVCSRRFCRFCRRPLAGAPCLRLGPRRGEEREKRERERGEREERERRSRSRSRSRSRRRRSLTGVPFCALDRAGGQPYALLLPRRRPGRRAGADSH